MDKPMQHTQDKQAANITLALVGNPNCGKTTLFNALTGAQQRIGNWPGVTVERKTGHYKVQDTKFDVIDLPGTYSFTTAHQRLSRDEQIARDYILQQQADVYINIIDVNHLERHLYLTVQLLEMGIPVIVVLNMIDRFNKLQNTINTEQLAEYLGCPVLTISASKNIGINELKNHLHRHQHAYKNAKPIIQYPDVIENACQALVEKIANNCATDLNQTPTQTISQWQSMVRQALASGQAHIAISSAVSQQNLQQWQTAIEKQTDEQADLLIADTRYQWAHDVSKVCVKRQDNSNRSNLTNRIDKIVLNRYLGIPIFFAVMYLMFMFAINIGGAFQDFFDMTSDALFVQGLAHGLGSLHAPTWLIAILASGVGKGINTTITFVPVIAAMFFFLSFLEASGYMARAAFVVDRVMRSIGLPGKSFVPMVMGFGCNVPAVMATRTLPSQRDRILTVLMSPFMSCSARLAIFAVFATAFFPVGGQNVVFALYILGIVMALLTGFIMRKTLLPGNATPLVMELPAYHWPNLRSICLQTWSRLRHFITKAGRVIVPVCILLGVLNAITIHGQLAMHTQTDSLLAQLGKWITPIFKPMGMHVENWPATVGLMTGMLAKEVVVATLNTLYSEVAHLASLHNQAWNLLAQLKAAVMTIPHNLMALPQAFGNPVMASVPEHSVNPGVYGAMVQRFQGQVGAMAYLIFVLLYIPCVSTIAVINKELTRGWSLFATGWSLILAYATAVIFYQLMTIAWHPLASSLWIAAMLAGFSLVLFIIAKQRGAYANRSA